MTLRLDAPRVGLNPGTVALVVAMGIWGATYLVTKSALDSFGAFTIILIRFVLAAAVLVPFAYRRGFRLRMAFARPFVVFGFTGMVLHLGLENAGLQFTSAGSAALIIATAPAVTMVASMIGLGERPRAAALLGIGLSVVGAALVTGAGTGGAGSGEMLGDLLVFGGVVAWAVFTIQGKRLSDGYPAIVSTAAATVAAVAMTVPIVVLEIALRGAPDVNGGALAAVAYLGLGASAGAYGLWNYSLRYVGASVAGAFVNLVPVIGVGLAMLAGESLSAGQWAGGAAVAGGVWLAQRGSRTASVPAGGETRGACGGDLHHRARQRPDDARGPDTGRPGRSRGLPLPEANGILDRRRRRVPGHAHRSGVHRGDRPFQDDPGGERRASAQHRDQRDPA